MAAVARDVLLARIVQLLSADVRVAAAWLSGSIGRGEADEWSDLDLHVAISDEHLESFWAERQQLYHQVGGRCSFGAGYQHLEHLVDACPNDASAGRVPSLLPAGSSPAIPMDQIVQYALERDSEPTRRG